MIEVLKQAMEAFEDISSWYDYEQSVGELASSMYEASCLAKSKANELRQAIAELESQKPVAWLLTEKNINSLQVDSIQLLIDRLKHAHHTDLCVRINGQDEWFQADWLKHMVRAMPPQRTWVGLMDDDEILAISNTMPYADRFEFAKTIEAKLKERNDHSI